MEIAKWLVTERLGDRHCESTMAESSKRARKKGSVLIEPISFSELSEAFKERLKEKELHLRAAGLWEFLTELEIPWPWPADLSEFVISAHASNFQRLSARMQTVRFDTEAIAQVTKLPGEDCVPVSESCRAIDAPEWGMAFEGGQLAFNVKEQGWDLEKTLPPWRDWLLLIQQRIELGRHGGYMEHCVVCTALAAWIRGTKFNWAGEVQSRIKEELEDYKFKRPMPLGSAGYIGMLCQFSFDPAITLAIRRTVAPFLPKPEGFLQQEPTPQTNSPPPSPEPPVILEEVVEMHGDRPAKRKPDVFCLPWSEESVSTAYNQAVEREWQKKMAKVLEEIKVQKGLVEKQRQEASLAYEEVPELKSEKEKLSESVRSLIGQLKQSEGEKKEWKKKSEEAVTFISQVLKEKEDLGKEITRLTREKSEWLRQKERQEQAIATKSTKIKNLEAQAHAFLVDEKNTIDLQQQVKSLQSLRDTQSIAIESLKRKVERLKSGIWAIESVCPPFRSLFKNYEMQRDIFFVVYSLRPNQVLSPSEFEELWEEVTVDGYEHLLTEILVRGGLSLQDMFKGFQVIADLGVHVFLYYSQLELTLNTKRQLVVATEANPPVRNFDLRPWNQAVSTALAICPPSMLQPWQAELARLKSSLGNNTFLQSVMDAASARLAISKHLDIGAGQYQLKFDQMNERLARNL